MATQEPNLKRAKWPAARAKQAQLRTTPNGKANDAPMERVCFVLQVKSDRIEEYKERHRAVWPEMLAALRETGWTNYSLFLRPDGLLIGYLETQDFDRARREIALRAVNERWQAEMAKFFVQENGLLPDQTIVSLEEVFHL
jgi:L-rhamnose mutarotase